MRFKTVASGAAHGASGRGDAARRACVAGLAALGFASGAFGAPRAQSEIECGVAADMAVVARSLAEEDVQRPKADAIMRRIYAVSTARGQELMDSVVAAAYSPKIESSQVFAETLLATCLQNGGDMDDVLGRSL